MEDFDLRELRYFLAVSDELNFSRAAERLGISQPPLSRAVRRMERRLGGPLFLRERNALRLTAAGSTLRDEALKVLEVASAAAHRTRRAAEGAERLTVTAAPGLGIQLLRRIIETYAALPDACEADIAVSGCGSQDDAVRSGRADLAVLSTPYADAGLEIRPLWSEERVAALPAGHRLARRGLLRCRDLAGEAFPVWPGVSGQARRYWTGLDTAADVDGGGRPGPSVYDMSQLIEVIALGQAVALLPRHMAERNPRVDVAYVPVADADPFSAVLAWPQGPAEPAVELFVETAADLFEAPQTADARPSA
ncbi:LysR family transcriptional regulator [Streptomonospora litoralis]|nr:LysR family transcriptional regulator [Streptomonospora litoralis]